MKNNIIDKYWLIIFLTSNIAAQYQPIAGMSNIIFLLSQVLGSIYCILNIGLLLSKEMSKRFSFVYAFAIIYIVYQLTFGMMHINERTWNYLISKIVVNFSIALCIYKNRNVAFSLIPILFAVIVPMLILFGFSNYNTIYGGRSTMGFGNPNSLGSIGAITFGICLFCETIKSRYVNYALASICLFAVLMSGSRGAMGILLISLLFKLEMKIKNALLVVIFVVGAIFIPPLLGYNPVGISRLVETTKEKDAFSSGRETERKASILMIKENPITGNGLYAGQSKEAKKISELGSHNAYIDFMKMLGIPLGLLLEFLMLKQIFLLYRKFKGYPDIYKMNLFIVVSSAFAANFEAYIWGVNHFVTSLFFVSICLLQQESYENTELIISNNNNE